MRHTRVFAAALAASLWGAAIIGFGLPAPVQAADAAAEVPSTWALKGVVILSRHGLRAPTNPVSCEKVPADHLCMHSVTRHRWPSFGVSTGYLMKEGVPRLETLGAFYGAKYAAVLPQSGCPAKGTVFFTSAGDQRTHRTGVALAKGLFPTCPINVTSDAATFWYPKRCNPDPGKANAAALKLIGSSWKAAAAGELKRPLAVMNTVLGPFRRRGCTYYETGPGCSLATLPFVKGGNKEGPINAADQPSELFLMEYGAGLPTARVGWGKLAAAAGTSLPEAITMVNAIHALAFRAGNMPKYQARRAGSRMLAAVAESLSHIAEGTSLTKLHVFAGHDNNILNVAGLLGFTWRLDSYQPYQAPPGGAVAFEVWQPPAGEAMIRAVYYAQTIDQMRRNTPLTVARPPASAVMPVAGCSSTAGACPWSSFDEIAHAEVDPDCL